MAPIKEKIGYGFGDMASSMFWKVFSYYLPFFYANIFGISLIDTGVLLLVTRIWDAVSDPMMGIVADRTKTRWGNIAPISFGWPRHSLSAVFCCSQLPIGDMPQNWFGLMSHIFL